MNEVEKKNEYETTKRFVSYFLHVSCKQMEGKQKGMNLAEEIAKEHAHFASVHETNTGFFLVPAYLEFLIIDNDFTGNIVRLTRAKRSSPIVL